MKDIIELFTFTSIGFGLMLSFKLLTQRRRGLIVMWLGLYVLLLVGSLCEIFFNNTEVVILFIGATYWLFGPSLYLYVHERLNLDEVRLFRTYALHMLPFLAYVILLLLTALLGLEAESELIGLILYEAVFAHIIIYFFKALQLLRRHQPTSHHNAVDKMQRASMLFLVIASLAIFGSSWLTTHVFALLGINGGEVYSLLVQGIISLLIFGIALFNTEIRYTERMNIS